MVLLDEGLEAPQCLDPGPGPLHMGLALVLPVLEHPVQVELAGVAELFDV